MPLYYYLISCTILLAFVFLIYEIFKAKQDLPVELFIQGLERENKGDLEKATLIYTNALREFKKIRSNSKLTRTITGKLGILATIMTQEKAKSLKVMVAFEKAGLRRPLVYGTAQTKEFFQNCVLSYNLN